MKIITLFLFAFLLSTTAFAQKQHSTDTTAIRTISADGSHYIASNGTVYKKGGTIQVGAGTNTNGLFRYCYIMLGNLVIKTMFMPAHYSGEILVIQEFKRETMGNKRVYAVVKKPNGKVALFIEAGLASGELK
ncbi:MAG: hypothetical protein H7202_04170 [Pedobacter sp.]|nr:hypothetical protein [Pedobacter sp.]